MPRTAIPRPVALVVLDGLLHACSDDPPFRPAPVTLPAATPTPAPAATPSPSPSPSAASENNAPTIVEIEGGGACHPWLDKPCYVAFRVKVKERDGDDYTIEWRGCASGSDEAATCVIDKPGVHRAQVIVTDVHGAFDKAAAEARGTNSAPLVRIGVPLPPNPAPPNTVYNTAGGQPIDPEEDWDPNRICTTARVTASGPCTAGLAWCGGVGDAFDIDIRTLPGGGTCVVEATAQDGWGAVGRDRISFQVNP
jgi:hypothetical protein